MNTNSPTEFGNTMIGEIAISPDAAKIAAGFIAKNQDALTSTVRSIVKSATDAVLLHSHHCYKTYLQVSIELNSKSRSFFHRTIPVNIYDFFVPMGIEYSTNSKHEVSINDILEINNHIVIQASAGYGKSIFLRHLFLTAIETCHYIPVLLDLRTISEKEQSLLMFLHEKMHEYGFEQDIDFFSKGLELGHFLLFLDGFDEISPDRRILISKEINNIAAKNPNSPVIVTSRPDNAFTSWEKFSVVTLSPLSRQNAVELVKKTPEEQELKSKFIDDLEKNLFDKHDTFLRNPLLLSIMVLTYTKSANVPTKISLFYDNAYHALFEGHDALKGGFQRKRQCQIDILDFSKVFASFCVQTYGRQEYTISKIRALEVAEKAVADQNFQIEASDFLEDCLQSVCLLIEDGLFISFSHRSFQEYFVAKFVSNCPDSAKPALIDRVSENARFDSVLPILWEIDEFAFEKHYLIPRASELFEEIKLKSKVGYLVYVRFMKLAFSEINYLHAEGLDFTFSLRHRSSTDSMWRWIRFVEDRFNFGEKFVGHTSDERKKLKQVFENEFRLRKGSESIATKKISSRSEFWRLLFHANAYFSKLWLEEAHEIYLKLESKHRNRESEILELLDQN